MRFKVYKRCELHFFTYWRILFFFLSYVNSENNCHFSWIFNNPPPKLLIFIVLLGNFQKRNLMIAYIIIPNCKINYIRFLEIFNVT